MSDFDIPTNSITDENDIANLSDVEGYYVEGDNDQEDNEIEEIDMDDEPITYSNKILGKLVIKKPLVVKDIPIPISIPQEKKKFAITKKTSSQNKTDTKPNDLNEKPVEKTIQKGKEKSNEMEKSTEIEKVKETKVDAKFEFNEQTIEFYTKDTNLNIKDICVKKSAFRNDTVLLCLLFKAHILTEYRCNIKKCKTGKTWLGKPIQLLLNRKNGRMEDLTTMNLELICPNCYIVQYGLELFQKMADQTIYKCKLCNFPLNKFSNTKKKEGYCLACESKMINASYYSKQSEYINELKDTIDNTSALKQDEFTKSNYYNEVSQYKTFKDNGKSKTDIKSGYQNKVNDKPIIKLNMNIPDLSNLINEDDDEYEDA